MPRTFYRIHSRTPLSKPKLVIGGDVGADANTGWVETYSVIFTARERARKALKAAKRADGFGAHVLQVLTFEPGLQVMTEQGVVKICARPGQEERRGE